MLNHIRQDVETIIYYENEYCRNEVLSQLIIAAIHHLSMMAIMTTLRNYLTTSPYFTEM